MDLRYNGVGIEVTRRCNQQCHNYCMRGAKQNLDISLEFIDLLLDLERNHYQYIDHLTFSGGEPTLNAEAILYTVNKIISEKLPIFHVSLMTNGLIYSDKVVEAFEKFNDYYNTVIVPILLSKYPRRDRKVYEPLFKDNGSAITFSNDQYHKPIPDEVLNLYYKNGKHISFGMTGPRAEKDLLRSGLSTQGRDINYGDDIRVFGDLVWDFIYLTAKGNYSGYGDGSFDFLDETSKDFSVTDYTLNDFCFEKLSTSSKLGNPIPKVHIRKKFFKK